MKPFQNKLRALILAGSIAGFLSGWGLFAHSGKPAASVVSAAPAQVQVAPLPTLPPLPQAPANPQPFQVQPLPSLPASPRIGFPRLRTSGS